VKRTLTTILCLLMLPCFGSIVLCPDGIITLADGGVLAVKGSDPEPGPPAGWMNATMTALDAPSPHVVSFVGFGSGSDIWKWFDHDEGTVATYSELPVAGKGVKYNFGTASAAQITELKVKNVSGQGLENWTLSASHDDVSYDQLATGTFLDNETLQSATFTNTDKYQYYKIIYDSVHSAGTTIQMYEVELWGS